MPNNSVIPHSEGQVQTRLLKFKPGGPTVEEAKAEMLARKEAATTTGGGTKIPSFIEKNSRGQGGNTTVEQPVLEAPVVVRTPQNEIPVEPVGDIVRDNRTLQALKFNAQQKLRQAGYRNGMSVDIVAEVKNGTLTKGEGEALLGALISIEEPSPAPEVEEIVVEKQAERVPVIPEPEMLVIEEPNFTAKVLREGKTWVLEISYKNGAGSERFSAKSKDELLQTLAKAKGHATLKIREESERLKRQIKQAALDNKYETWDAFFKLLKEMTDISVEDYNVLPEKSKDLVIAQIQTNQCEKFIHDYPEFYATQYNYDVICKHLNQNQVPMLYHNLQLAYFHLGKDGLKLLEEKPTETEKIVAPAEPSAAASVSVTTVATPAEDSTVVEKPVVSISAAAETPAAPVIRKRAVSGLVPGSSSATPSGVSDRSEDRVSQRELSAKELREMPMNDLKRIATQGRKYGVRY